MFVMRVVFKRGQITGFIILGVVLVFLAGLYFYMQTRGGESLITPSGLPVASVKVYVESCLQTAGTEAVNVIGETGGYAELPNFSAKKHAYYFYENKSLMPSKSEIEEQLAKYAGDNLFFCLKNFEEFQDLNITQGRISSSAEILEEGVSFKVTLPLTITRNDQEATLSKFSAEVKDVRLGVIYDFAKNFTDSQVDDPENLCLSCLSRATRDANLWVEFMPIAEGTLMIIQDNQSIVDGEPYTFKFVNKYS